MSVLPVAVRLGLTHVSVIRSGESWAACMWSRATGGPVPIFMPTDHEAAVDRARAYAAIDPANRVLDLPDGLGEIDGRALVHVERRADKLEILHESSSGNSFATLRLYDAKDRKRALLFAIDILAQYGNPRGASRLGRVSA